MEGYLKIFVLRELSLKELSGYELMKSYADYTGTKRPSPGTIYPLLSNLLRKRLIKVTLRDKKKFYTITDNGRQVIRKMAEERKSLIESKMRILSSIYSKKEINRLRKTISIFSGEKKYLEKDFDVINDLKTSVVEFVTSGNYEKRRSDFRKIIKDSTIKIKSLGK